MPYYDIKVQEELLKRVANHNRYGGSGGFLSPGEVYITFWNSCFLGESNADGDLGMAWRTASEMARGRRFRCRQLGAVFALRWIRTRKMIPSVITSI
jgi:hypothetical protein